MNKLNKNKLTRILGLNALNTLNAYNIYTKLIVINYSLTLICLFFNYSSALQLRGF